MDDEKIEAIASSFYAVEYNSHSWSCAPEVIKDEFRLYARSAIALCRGEYGILDSTLTSQSNHNFEQQKYMH
jgi:hypothetical protein